MVDMLHSGPKHERTNGKASLNKRRVRYDEWTSVSELTPFSHIIQNTTLFWTKPDALQSDVGIAAYAVRTRFVLAFEVR